MSRDQTTEVKPPLMRAVLLQNVSIFTDKTSSGAWHLKLVFSESLTSERWCAHLRVMPLRIANLRGKCPSIGQQWDANFEMHVFCGISPRLARFLLFSAMQQCEIAWPLGLLVQRAKWMSVSFALGAHRVIVSGNWATWATNRQQTSSFRG